MTPVSISLAITIITINTFEAQLVGIKTPFLALIYFAEINKILPWNPVLRSK
ncbi:hypothetical protein D3C84_1082840 [compost metagenome]